MRMSSSSEAICGRAANRARHLRTVFTSHPRRRAISALAIPSAAKTTIRARTTRACGARLERLTVSSERRTRRRSTMRLAAGPVMESRSDGDRSH